jgi:hypothetical protein
MLFKRGDRFTLVVKNDTHKGQPNKHTMLRYGVFDKDSKFLVSKNCIIFKDTVVHEHRRMRLTNIFAMTNITRLDEELEQQTPTNICRAKTCDNALVGGWVSKSDPRYCQDCL